MKRAYDDILSLTDRKPSFFQKDGVPRWADFRPGESTGTSTCDCAIVEIACQLCDARFHVLMESTSIDRMTIAEAIRGNTLRYLDPPNVGCCRSGPSMTSTTIRVIEYWERQHAFQWRRDASLEMAFRQPGDPWDAEAMEKARAMIASDDIDEPTRDTLKRGLAQEEARAHMPAEPSDEPVRFSEFRTTVR